MIAISIILTSILVMTSDPLPANISQADSVAMTVRVGNTPIGVTFDPSNGDIYVTNGVDGTVSVISGASNTVVTTVFVGGEPSGIAYDPRNGDIYVANLAQNVSVVSGASNKVVADVPLTLTPPLRAASGYVAFDSANGEIYVSDSFPTFNAQTVSVVSGVTESTTINVGPSPEGLAFDPSNANIYVANFDNFGGDYERSQVGNISVISGETGAVVARIRVGNSPFGVAYDPSNGDIYSANAGDGTVTVISGETDAVVTTVTIGGAPFGIAFGSDSGDIYVSNANSGTVSVISSATNSVINTVPVGTKPEGIAYDSSDGDVYVANAYDGTVSVIQPGTNFILGPSYLEAVTLIVVLLLIVAGVMILRRKRQRIKIGGQSIELKRIV